VPLIASATMILAFRRLRATGTPPRHP
jgi:hypothetical protein